VLEEIFGRAVSGRPQPKVSTNGRCKFGRYFRRENMGMAVDHASLAEQGREPVRHADRLALGVDHRVLG
jgi:hypothetical protein